MSEHRPGIIIQARMGSTRLPGKVMLRVQGISLLGHLLRRLRRLETTRRIVVASTSAAQDRVILDEARCHGAETFAGSEHDVLERYVEAACRFEIDPVVRITSDCPLADPAVIDAAIERYRRLRAEGRPVDAVTNTRRGHRTFPRGLDVEVVSLAALERVHSTLSADAPAREHVTMHLYRSPALFKVVDLERDEDLSRHRWTVDTAEDFRLVEQVYDALYPTHPEFGLDDVVELLRARPELAEINAHILQKSS